MLIKDTNKAELFWQEKRDKMNAIHDDKLKS
jgi:hypothetical protein